MEAEVLVAMMKTLDNGICFVRESEGRAMMKKGIRFCFKFVGGENIILRLCKFEWNCEFGAHTLLSLESL